MEYKNYFRDLEVEAKKKEKNKYGIYFQYNLSDENKKYVEKLVDLAKEILKIEHLPKIEILDKSHFEIKTSTASYEPGKNDVRVVADGRAIADVLRSLSHELTHHRQHELEDLKNNSGKTGSKHENQANTLAGIIMRKFSEKYPEIYI